MDFGATKLGEAAYFSQRFTTVSPTYAWEVRVPVSVCGVGCWGEGGELVGGAPCCSRLRHLELACL